jgi:hypothetical protein
VAEINNAEGPQAPPKKIEKKGEASRPADRPSMGARTIAGFLVLGAVLILVLAQAFAPVFCKCQVNFPPSAYPLVAAAVVFWFNVKLSDINKKD